MNCSKCNSPLDDGLSFCENCGAKVQSENTQKAINNEKDSEKNTSYKNKIIIAIIATIVIIVGIIFLSSKSKRNGELIFYVKDNQLQVMDSRLKPVTIDNGLVFEGEDNGEIADLYSRDIRYNKDKTIVYFPKFTLDKNGDIESFSYNYFDLKKYRLSSINEKSVEVEYVDEYESYDFSPNVSEDGKILFYKLNGALYIYKQSDHINEKIVPVNNLEDYVISDDGLTVYYTDNYSSLRTIDIKTLENKLVDIDVFKIQDMLKNGNTIYYTKQNDNEMYTLCKYDGENEPVIIDENVKDIVTSISDNGKFYYSKVVEGTKNNLYEFVNDDLLEQDDAIGEPLQIKEPDYPNQADYQKEEWIVNPQYNEYYKKDVEIINNGDTVKGFNDDEITTIEGLREDYIKMNLKYNEEKDEMGKWQKDVLDTDAFNKALDEYKKENEKYWQQYEKVSGRVSNDKYREKLKDTEIILDGLHLYCYDGKKSEIVTNTFKKDIAFSQKSGAFIYTSYDVTNRKENMLDFSTIVNDSSYNNVYDQMLVHLTLNNFLYSNNNSKVIRGDYSIPSGVYDLSGLKFYFENYIEGENDNRKDLKIYSLDIKSGDISIYNENINGDIYLENANQSDSMIYYDWETDNRGSIYFDNEKVVSNAYLVYGYDFNSLYNFPNSDNFIYFIASGNEGALMISANGESTEITDVCKLGDFTILDNKILYISNGQLYIYNQKNQQSKLIDDSVTSLSYSEELSDWRSWHR